MMIMNIGSECCIRCETDEKNKFGEHRCYNSYTPGGKIESYFKDYGFDFCLYCLFKRLSKRPICNSGYLNNKTRRNVQNDFLIKTQRGIIL